MARVSTIGTGTMGSAIAAVVRRALGSLPITSAAARRIAGRVGAPSLTGSPDRPRGGRAGRRAGILQGTLTRESTVENDRVSAGDRHSRTSTADEFA